MPTPRQRRLVRQHAALTLVALVALALGDALTLPVAVVASLLALLLAAEFTAPVYARPPWRARLRWILLLGALLVVVLGATHVATVARTLDPSLAYS
ncbi:hypothetical protein [Halarchaeum nitratireducens]|uniref:Uncharacterized protein n=1 Tax=Halarchaeum nitratireducens TaxID=489913 RepID=A0A830GB38_9EURY|nr:hypothetical protein [Halarchaeum nitratireducens]GGN16740.1 hypothetical protein GCM10009021_16770 [Halarchaeum nitratireducens]